LPQEPVRFDQIGDRLALAAIEPTSHGEEQQLEDRKVVGLWLLHEYERTA
jgi:hypothetical protein